MSETGPDRGNKRIQTVKTHIGNKILTFSKVVRRLKVDFELSETNLALIGRAEWTNPDPVIAQELLD